MPLPATLTNWRTLTRSVNLIKPDARFIRDLVFPGQGQVFSTPDIRFDVIEGGRETAPFVKRGGEAYRIHGYGHKRNVLETPNIKLKMEIDPEAYAQSAGPGDIQEILAGSNAMEASSRARAARDLTRMKRMAENTVEWMCSRALDASLSYSGSEGTDAWTITYANRTGYDANWALTTTDLLGEIRTWKHAMNKQGYNPVAVVMGETAAGRVLSLDQWKTTYLQALPSRFHPDEVKQISLTSPIGANGAVFEGVFGQLPWYTYTYEVTPYETGSAEQLIPPNNLYLIAQHPDNEIYYGGIYDMRTMERSYAIREFSKAWENDDPSLGFVSYQSRPLPVLKHPFTILKVITSDS